MPFITQGPEGEQAPYRVNKTNWRFLLIVIILAIIVGGWILLGLTLPIPSPWQPPTKTEKGVIITTDKTEYEQGELIKITVRNGLDVPILYSDTERFWGVEYFEDEEWKNLEYESGGGFQLTKEDLNDICYIKLYERMPPVEMKSYSTLSQEWNQRICPFGEGDPGEPRFVKYIGAGRYRLIFYYGFEISNEDPYEISNQKNIYSNEFTIKESTIADWKTYRNEEYGFEFNYPKFFTKENGCSIEESENGISIGFRAGLSIEDPRGLLLEDYVNKDASGEGIEIESKENTTVGGKDAIKVSYRTIGVGRYGTDTYLLKGNKAYIFSFFAGAECPATSENDSSELEVLDNIISTFRFIELSTSEFKIIGKDKETDWNIVGSDKYGIEINYPNSTSFSTTATSSYLLGNGWTSRAEPDSKGNVIASFTICKFSDIPPADHPSHSFTSELRIGASSNPKDVENCLTFWNVTSEKVGINGEEFRRFKTSDAGAGNRAGIDVYRIVSNNICFSVEKLEYGYLYDELESPSSPHYNSEYSEKFNSCRQTINQMLSTFKFIE